MFKYDAMQSIPDSRDWTYNAEKKITYPEIIDFRKVTRILNQGKEGSCAAHAAAVAKTIHEWNESGSFINFAPKFIYSQRENKPYAGMTSRDVMKIMTNAGSCPAKYWRGRFDNSEKIPQDILSIAKEFSISGYAKVGTIGGLKRAIYNNGSCYLVLPVYQSADDYVPGMDFWQEKSDRSMPDIYNRELAGYHAVSVIGYNDERGHIIIQNSWGRGWGDAGYTYMPYEDFNHINVIECYTMIDSETADIFRKRGRLMRKFKSFFKKK